MITKIPNMKTIKETAEIFGLPEHLVRHKVINGEVIAITAGRRYLVNVDKFVEYLNTHTVSVQNEQVYEGIKPIPVKL